MKYEKYLLIYANDHQIDGQSIADEDMLADMLVFDGSRIGLYRNPPDFSSAVQVPPGKKPTDRVVINKIKKNILKIEHKFHVKKLIQDFGEYYPRIYRPFMRGAGRYEKLESLAMIEVNESVYDPNNPHSNMPIPINKQAYVKSLSQLVLLTQKLKDIFRTVEPEAKNLKVYGHEIRNLLISTCTEVEAQCKGVLLENKYIKRGTLNTTDYVKTLNPLKLADYQIEFPLYPGISPLSPFAKWSESPGMSTKSLIWYDAYNKTKHNRETNFSDATIINLVNAVAACAILLVAQYGKRKSWKNELNEFFLFSKVPVWKPEEMYISHQQIQKYTAVPFSF